MRRLISKAMLGACLLWSATCTAAPAVGDVPPDYVGTDFEDRPVSLSQFKGRVVILTFWASWCAPCRAEMDILDRMQRVAGRDALAVIAVNFKEDNRIWRVFRKKLKAASLTITRDVKQQVPVDYGVDSIPRMFMIDKAGRIARIHKGYDESSLDRIIEEINVLLAQAPGVELENGETPEVAAPPDTGRIGEEMPATEKP